MSEKNAEAKIIEELDETLFKMNGVETEAREAEREVERIRAKMGAYEQQSQRLRWALYALRGEVTSKNAGDVNKDNLTRRNEIKREASR